MESKSRTAKITVEGGFNCAPDGHTIVNFPYSTVVDGKVAEWAIAAMAAKVIMKKRSTKAISDLENK